MIEVDDYYMIPSDAYEYTIITFLLWDSSLQ